ncbi:hypothetical protein C7212DRAFT_350104 [Tuber magnatum]|uniref:DUF676 domain-containing protein n=1 Tax=Tuber magnatum TaxID=42249 RepID=A0A317SW94_9PEZI|nr:hypothetical protein C7212DRAFT_350104 [Tuber magnatum]
MGLLCGEDFVVAAHHFCPQPRTIPLAVDWCSYSYSQGDYNPTPDCLPRGKWKLLLIHIHGFVGNQTRFQSFPAHLHNLLSVTLNDLGWGIHTKVYAKLMTRHNISTLAAGVVLLSGAGGLSHRMLGVVPFDSPFLGTHPGVISTGFRTLFRSEGKGPSEGGGSSGGGARYLMSQLEYGSCLADPEGLKNRYSAIRKIETTAYSVHSLVLAEVEVDRPGARELQEMAGEMRLGKPQQRCLGRGFLTRPLLPPLFHFRIRTSGISPPFPKPTKFDYSQIPHATVRTAAGKAAAKAAKLWEKSVKNYEKVAKDWEEAGEETERKKREKENKEKMKSATARLRGGGTTAREEKKGKGRATVNSTPTLENPQWKKRERKFCLSLRTLDACWIKVEMTGVDEVATHCGLFFLGDMYERLVGDVAGMIEGWMEEEGSRRLLEEEEGGGVWEEKDFWARRR